MLGNPDTIRLRGDIEINVRNRVTGQVIRKISVRNKIVSAGVAALPYLLARIDAENRSLSALAVGSGTASPSALDTSLQNEITGSRVMLSDVNLSFPSAGQLKVDVRLNDSTSGAPEALEISEAGLFLANGALFARQIHDPITTAPGIQLDYAWVLTFTA